MVEGGFYKNANGVKKMVSSNANDLKAPMQP